MVTNARHPLLALRALPGFSAGAVMALTLVERVGSDCAIVLPADAGGAEELAAEELAWHPEQMSGARRAGARAPAVRRADPGASFARNTGYDKAKVGNTRKGP